MAVEIPKPIELTEAEKEIESQIRFDLKPRRDKEAILECCERCHDLMASLIERKAIPQARMDFFIEADHNIGSSKSRLDVFRSKGVKTEDVLRNPYFYKNHLRYFLYGPQLPAETIQGFCDIIEADVGDQGMVLDQLCRFVRSQVRKHHLAKSESPAAFYLLALECGEEFGARAIRDAAKSVKATRG